MPFLVTIAVYAATVNYPQAVTNIRTILHHTSCFLQTAHRCKPTKSEKSYTGLE